VARHILSAKPFHKDSALTLEKEYWQTCYSEPETMDGILNAAAHMNYARALFKLQEVQINSLIDLGFGTGDMYKAFTRGFKPERSMGIEPSHYIFQQALRKLSHQKSQLVNISLEDWCGDTQFNQVWDLAVCTSVLQYIQTSTLKRSIPILAQRVKYLYLTVPTNKEMGRQLKELEFEDPFALRRTKQTYRELFSAHFTIVGCRLLESKHFYSEKDSQFTEFLFRE